jgi:DNA-binding CsgD family transcriptional regulator
MKAIKTANKKYRSRSAYVRILLSASNFSQSEIARKAKMTPQTVFAIKKAMEKKSKSK